MDSKFVKNENLEVDLSILLQFNLSTVKKYISDTVNYVNLIILGMARLKNKLENVSDNLTHDDIEKLEDILRNMKSNNKSGEIHTLSMNLNTLCIKIESLLEMIKFIDFVVKNEETKKEGKVN